jgi:RND family efflux transporter MFP subunit
MKKLIYLIIPAMILASCGENKGNKAEELVKLKKQKAEIEIKIKELEAGKADSGKVTPVTVLELQPTEFNGNIEVQSAIAGDENIFATTQAPGIVKKVLVHTGQNVSAGQLLVQLDAATIDRQIDALSPQLALTKSLFEKQQNLWSQNIGTEVQLMGAKTNYEAVQKQIAALKAQRDIYRIVSPISGSVDEVNIKEGEMAAPGMSGVRVVSYDKLKAEAKLGENYLGKVKEGDPVTLIFPSAGDSIKTKISYVAKSVDVSSRSFVVYVQLNNSAKLHPNMSCIMKIANYTNKTALVIPVALLQKTSEGEVVYVAEGNTAKATIVKTGRTSNGLVEVLEGLNPGDKVILAGHEDMENGQRIVIQ